jgi:DNA-directed RNA polymerase subunit F
MKVIDEQAVTLAEVASILKKKDKEYGEREVEFLYEQRRAYDHAVKFAKVGKKDANELQKKLSKLDSGISQDRIAKIVDLMPETVDDIRAIFAKERFKYSEEEIKEITDIVDQYR